MKTEKFHEKMHSTNHEAPHKCHDLAGGMSVNGSAGLFFFCPLERP